MGGDNTFPFGKTGGFPSPAGVVGEQARVSTAESRGGFTASQASVVIQLLQRMVILLGGIDTKGKHPEARRAQRAGSANFDTQ